MSQTDGLADNVYPAEISSIVSLVMRQGASEERQAQDLADRLVEYARICMFKKNKVSPFESMCFLESRAPACALVSLRFSQRERRAKGSFTVEGYVPIFYLFRKLHLMPETCRKSTSMSFTFLSRVILIRLRSVTVVVAIVEECQ